MTETQYRRYALKIAFCCLVTALIAELIAGAGWLQRVDTTYNDAAFRIAGMRDPVSRVALIELDDATLARYPDDPLVFWTPQFARVLQVLARVEARVVGLDFLFSTSPELWFAKVSGNESRATRAFDRSFREALATGRVVLGGMQSGPDPLLPSADYLAVLPDFNIGRFVGATDLVMDTDGIFRHLRPLPPGAQATPAGEVRLLPFSLLLALHATQQSTDSERWAFGNREFTAESLPWPLAWAGPPGTVPRLSMQQLLAEGAENDPAIRALHDKVVIVGVAYGGSNDVHMTPFGHGATSSRWMRGPEIQAQAVDALLSGRFVDPLSTGARSALLAATLILGALCWARLAAGFGALALGGILSILVLLGYALHLRWIVMPVAEMQLAAIMLFLMIYGLRFSSGERDRERIRRMFSRYVSRDVVKKLLDSEEMPILGGEAVEVSVLFSDIRGFTTISERLRPEEVVEMLNRWLAAACGAVQRHGGSVDKFIGDAIMAEFGAPLHVPDHAARALRAAVELREVAGEMQTWMTQRFAGRDLPPFAIGVGVHSGRAVVGNIGSPDRMEYTAIGDTVNLASRLEGTTKTLDCAIAASRTTVDLAGLDIVIGERQTLTVKGREEPVEVLAVLAIKE